MTEVCTNGHIRTPENTSWVKWGRGENLKRRCLDCRRDKRNTGRPTATDIQTARTTDLHENIEDLLQLGASFEEILQRGGFSTWKRLKTSLKNRERLDLIEQLETMERRVA